MLLFYFRRILFIAAGFRGRSQTHDSSLRLFRVHLIENKATSVVVGGDKGVEDGDF